MYSALEHAFKLGPPINDTLKEGPPHTKDTCPD